MGFFGSIIDAAKSANEEAHGSRLHAEFQDSMQRLRQLDTSQAADVFLKFVNKRQRIREHVANWSRDGRLKMADTLRAESRRVFDLNIVEGYALWMTSAWLESGERSSAKAAFVHAELDRFSIPEEPVVSSQAAPSQRLAGLDTASAFLAKRLESIAPLSRLLLLPYRKKLIAAVACGMAVATAKEYGLDPGQVLRFAAERLYQDGLRPDIVAEGFDRAIQDYNPAPTTDFGRAAWFGAEDVRIAMAGSTPDLIGLESFLSEAAEPSAERVARMTRARE
jgi:hypothetical protein